jgi:hypothetical protein
MKSLRLTAAVLIGFVLGALFHPMTTKAGDGLVYVKKVSINGTTLGAGSRVVGFSCTSSGSEAECYVATE